MSIDSIGPATTTGTTTQPGGSRASQDFAALAQALQQGDLAGAQQAFSTLSQDVPWVGRVASSQSAASSSTSGNATGTGPVTSAIQNLASALQSGDLAGAQKAFAALQQAHGGGGHHHGHHHHSDSQASSTTTTPTTPTPAVTATTGSAVDTLA
jgi:hypothetical protein